MRNTAPIGRASQGFSLIELMIVVAIVGILSSVALSSYQEFTARAKLMEVVTLARRDLDALRAYFNVNGDVPADPAFAGVQVSADQSQYLSADTAISWDGTLATVVYSVDAGGDAVGSLRYTGEQRGSDLHFTCSTPDLPARYVPPNCR